MRRSEYRSIVIQYERRPKFLFGNSSATPPPVSRGSLHPRLCFFFHFLRFWPRSQTQNLLLLFCRHRSISFGSRGIIISQMSKKTFVQHKCHLLLTRNEIFWDIHIIAYKFMVWLVNFLFEKQIHILLLNFKPIFNWCSGPCQNFECLKSTK